MPRPLDAAPPRPSARRRGRGRGRILALVIAAAGLVAAGALVWVLTRPPRLPALPRFSLIAYADYGAVPAGARRTGAQIADLWANATPAQIRALRVAAPGVKIVTYSAAVQVPGTDPQGLGECLRVRAGAAIPRRDLMLTRSGAPVRKAGTDDLWLDIGASAVQQACAAAAVRQAEAQHADGIFEDLVTPELDVGGTPSCPGGSPDCARQARYDAAWTSFLTTLADRLHEHRLMLILNIGAAFDYGGARGDYQQFWRQWSALADGTLEEEFGFGITQSPPALPQPAWVVRQELENFSWSEAHRKYAVANADLPGGLSPSARARDTAYGLGLELLVADGYSSWNVTAGGYGTPRFGRLSLVGAAQALGAPREGPVTTPREDGLYVRTYARGSVAVNTTGATIEDRTYGRVPAHTAIVR